MGKISNKDILNAIGDAKDDYISESAKVSEYRETKALSKGEDLEKKRIDDKSKKSWKKWALSAACIVVAFVVISGAISIGFSGGAKKSDDRYVAEAENDYGDSKGLSYYNKDSKQESYVDYNTPNASEYSDIATDNSNAQYNNAENVKLIYKANISAQTTEFENALQGLKNAVNSVGGYIESQNTYTGGYYSSLRSCTIVFRVPAESYRAFVDGISDNSLVVSHIYEDVDDVGLSYYETEQRLKTLYTKEERLHELLKEAKNLSDIITLENELSNTEYQIDSYTSQLNKYDSLINYSTVTVDLSEVYKEDAGIQTDNSFGARLARAFKQSFENFGEGVQDLILWISYNFVGLIIFAAIVFAFIKFRPITRLIRKIKKG